ncbi:TetR/AcrR family transcriptional regulator [Peribacillus frigoritolerans]|uniref:TetR/AcrR family transcriptional regulator n=1 Tax=Peribacillus frigoritolerans TaxID=450367 RepID=UPI00227DA25E|nr:TetR/AcrR family transcriptional regulator [Peribacillus frigoritolerans]MCY8939686.1 TetR/AcrR family transcriptional regulator [Peribacillus frigoritolerans]
MSKQQEIITISRKIIYSKGYQATSISDILDAAKIGKGQFYHYFSSKHDLGLAVVEDLVKECDQEIFLEIFQSEFDPITKLNKMLKRTLVFHTDEEGKSGCPVGNLAIEMSEHDETFRLKIQYIFDRWISSIEETLNELINQGHFPSNMDSKKHAQSIVAMIEGGVLLMKSQKDISFLTNVLDVIRVQYRLS